MKLLLIGIILISLIIVLFASADDFENDILINGNFECHQHNDGSRKYVNVSLTAYYPIYENNASNEYSDKKGKKLRTLQDYLDDQISFVTVSMDTNLNIPYGQSVCIPELNKHFKRNINFEIRDSNSNVNGFGYRRIDVCVRSEVDSYDRSVNLDNVTIII